MTSVACPHFDVSIRQRSKGQSAVAGAAYMSAEKLFCEYDQRTKNFCYKQKEIVAKGILLPPNAPREYTDRQTLWNAVEASEKQWNAQLARGIIMALPRELPADQYESLVREYCMEQFVLRGMIVDYAIHDKGDGNPHAHVMLTMRAMDEHGKWLPKARRVYILDENGEKIPLPNGDYKTRKERTTDWDDSGNCERWRTAWADTTNRYLERAGADVRLDLRSYERQGVDLVPTVHMGPVVTYLEQQGIRTEIGQYNEEIKQFNRVLQSLKIRLASLKKWLAEAIRKTAEIMKPEPYQPSVMENIQVFQNLRRAGRADWGKTAKQTAGINDLKFAAQVQFFMQEAGISTLKDFDEFVGKQQESLTQLDGVGKAIRKKQTALKAIPHKERTAKRSGKRYNKEVKKQLTMSLISDELGQASTKKKEFLGIMEKLIPWSQWVGIVQPHYYKGERGNKPYDLELMLRIYVLQHLYNLADDAARNEIIDSRAFSQFCGVDSSNQVPDGDTIGRFRHLLERNQLGEAFFTNVVESLQKCNLMLKKGTIVDSTLIAAPSSTKNKEKQRDPEAHSVKNGNQWYFGYKEHIGVDADSGLVHTLETTAANVHDSNMVVELLQGTEKDVYGDSGYLGAEKKDDAILVNNEGHPIRYQINKRPSQLKKASGEKFELFKAIEHAKSSVRSKVEHVFCVIKRIFHFCKTRYRGREKLHQHCCTLFALANLYLARNRMKVA